MTRMQLRDRGHNKVGASTGCKFWIICTVVWVVLFGLGTCGLIDSYKGQVKAANLHNDIISEYEKLSNIDREKMQPLLTTMNSFLTEEYEEKEMPKDWFDVWTKYWIKVLIIGCCLCYILCFQISYYWERNSCYHIVDLPFKKISGWAIFISLLPTFPVLIISYIRFLKTKRRLHNADGNFRITENTSYSVKVIDDAAKQLFLKLCGEIGITTRHKARLEETKTSIDNFTAKLKQLGNEVKGAQINLATARSEHERLKSIAPSKFMDMREVTEKWDSILTMRGVMLATVENGNLVIGVKVQVPYKERLYDFGDWKIILRDNRIQTERVRSGVRPGRNGSEPDYANGDRTFCFGSRRDLINEYLEEYNYAEAMVLAIDCLHSVNDSSALARIPDTFFEIVKPQNMNQPSKNKTESTVRRSKSKKKIKHKNRRKR